MENSTCRKGIPKDTTGSISCCPRHSENFGVFNLQKGHPITHPSRSTLRRPISVPITLLRTTGDNRAESYGVIPMARGMILMRWGRILKSYHEGLGTHGISVSIRNSIGWVPTTIRLREIRFMHLSSAALRLGAPLEFSLERYRSSPTVPISMPLYEGSGAGVIHYQSNHFPPEYQGMFFVNDRCAARFTSLSPNGRESALEAHRW